MFKLRVFRIHNLINILKSYFNIHKVTVLKFILEKKI